AGHAAPVPVHVSATSQTPEAARQTVPATTNRSAGHDAAVPVHVSATSQTPAAARQTVPATTNRSAGHDAEVPVQVSATSQAPVEARQVVPAGMKRSAGHTPAAARHTMPALPAVCMQLPLPSQASTVQGFPSSVHGVSAGWPVHTLLGLVVV